MNELHRVLLLVTLGTFALLLCLPACTHAQPEGVFKFDLDKYPDAAFDADYNTNPERLTREQVMQRLFELALARSNKGPAYTIPRRKRQSVGVGLFQLNRISMDEKLRNQRDLLDRMERNLETFDNAGRRR